MAVDTFMAYAGVYADVADARADYQLVKDLHTEAGLIDAYDAAVIERQDDGKVKIVKQHETPTRVGGVLGGGVGLATGLQAMRHAEKVQAKQFKADTGEIERDAGGAGG